MRYRFAVLALFLVCLSGGLRPDPALAQAGAAAQGEPFTLPNAEQRLMTASRGGREYQIYIAAPSQPPKDSGYPVIYILDANMMFLTAVEAVRAYERRRDDGGKLQALVVGIGYRPGTDIHAARTYDLSPSARDQRDGHSTGGDDDFRQFIERDLKPAITRDYPVDPGRQALMGHSFAGMFVLGTLARTPHAFQTYVAMSSSFWFDDHVLVSRIGDFIAARKDGDAPVRALLTVGQYEEQVRPEAWAGNPGRAAEALAGLRRRGQVTHASEVAARLAKAPATLVDFREIAGEDHGTVIPASIGRGIDFFLNGPFEVPPVPSADAYMQLGPEGRYRLRMQVRALPDLHRIPWLNALKTSLKAGLDAPTHARLHEERQVMDERYGSRPHEVNAD